MTFNKTNVFSIDVGWMGKAVRKGGWGHSRVVSSQKQLFRITLGYLKTLFPFTNFLRKCNGNPKTGHTRYSNGTNMVSFQIVQILNSIQNQDKIVQILNGTVCTSLNHSQTDIHDRIFIHLAF